jgi:hypothetical protein
VAGITNPSGNYHYYIEKIFKDSSGYNIPEDAKALTQVG